MKLLFSKRSIERRFLTDLVHGFISIHLSSLIYKSVLHGSSLSITWVSKQATVFFSNFRTATQQFTNLRGRKYNVTKLSVLTHIRKGRAAGNCSFLMTAIYEWVRMYVYLTKISIPCRLELK